MKNAQGKLLVTNGCLVDGRGGPPIKDACVIIENGKSLTQVLR